MGVCWGMLRGVVTEALRAAHESLKGIVARGSAGEPMGRGAYGDMSYRGDIVGEEAIFGALRKHLGDLALISEERGVVETSTDAKFWALVDPVDGSANMSRGLGFYSTGIALADSPYFHRILCSGVIDHLTGQIFLREGEQLEPAPALTGQNDGDQRPTFFFHHATIKKLGQSRPQLYSLLGKLRYFRVMGSALLEMCLVYAGSGDAYVCLTPELRMLDIAPALHLAQGGGLYAATYPRDITEERLDVRDRFGIVICRSADILQEVLKVAGQGWHVLDRAG